jgi:hypothetical protein
VKAPQGDSVPGRRESGSTNARRGTEPVARFVKRRSGAPRVLGCALQAIVPGDLPVLSGAFEVVVKARPGLPLDRGVIEETIQPWRLVSPNTRKVMSSSSQVRSACRSATAWQLRDRAAARCSAATWCTRRVTRRVCSARGRSPDAGRHRTMVEEVVELAAGGTVVQLTAAAHFRSQWVE